MKFRSKAIYELVVALSLIIISCTNNSSEESMPEFADYIVDDSIHGTASIY
jgi:hypothetical protein